MKFINGKYYKIRMLKSVKFAYGTYRTAQILTVRHYWDAGPEFENHFPENVLYEIHGQGYGFRGENGVDFEVLGGPYDKIKELEKWRQDENYWN